MEENIVQEQLDVLEETNDETDVQNSGENQEIDGDFSDNAEEINIRQLREAKAAAEKQAKHERQLREEQAQELARLRLLQEQKQAAPVENKTNPNYLLGEDDVVEGRDYNRVYSKVEDVNDKYEKLREQIEETTVNAQLSNDYPDYKQVVTTKNVEKLLKKYPEFADSLAYNKNKYTQYKTAYRLIKQFDIIEDQKATQEKKLIQQNRSKPAPTNAIGSKSTGNPLDQIHHFEGGLTEERKKELQRINREACMRY